tara:strand:- start:264 stop:446 length:183 start_codon:yes stop_codon:yes gene_type:complete
MLNKEIMDALENAMTQHGINEDNKLIIQKFLKQLASNSMKEKSERNAAIRNILSRMSQVS